MKAAAWIGFCLVAALPALAQAKPQILCLWENLEATPFTHLNGPWLALVEGEKGRLFLPVQARLDGGEMRVDGLKSNDVLFIMRGIKGPRPPWNVSVPLVDIPAPEGLDNGQPLGRMGDFSDKPFEVRERYSEGWTPSHSRLRSYSVRFRWDGLDQTLFRLDGKCAECMWELLWAGDLDGDGKPDLVMRYSPVYLDSEVQVWLSSLAKPGKLLGLAVSHSASGD